MRIYVSGLRRPFLPVLVLPVLVLSGCGGGDGGGGARSDGDTVSVPPAVMGEPSVYTSADGLLTFTLPERWGGEVTVRETAPADLAWMPPAPERVFQFILVPRDTRFAAENLFNLYLYDEAVWGGSEARLVAEVGTEVERRDGKVFVLSLPGPNPFPEGSVDHGRLERFRMSVDEVREALAPAVVGRVPG